MLKVVYNEGQGFTERIKEYETMVELMENEFSSMVADDNAKIYKNNERII